MTEHQINKESGEGFILLVASEASVRRGDKGVAKSNSSLGDGEEAREHRQGIRQNTAFKTHPQDLAFSNQALPPTSPPKIPSSYPSTKE